MTRLPRTYKAENHAIIPWDLLPVRERNDMKQLPDWLRRALSLPERYRRGHSMHVSREVEFAFNEVLERMVGGCNRDLQGASHLKMPVLLSTAQKIQAKWIEIYEQTCAESGATVDPERKKKLDRKWVYRFLSRWQWSYQESNTKGAYLADDSQEMKEMRLAHRAQRLAHNVPWTLCLNFDQLWRSSYEPPSKVLHKRRAKEATRQGEDFGEVRPSDLQGKKLNTVLNIVKDAMTERMGQTTRASKLRKTCARSEHVQGGRVGVTAVSSTWASGEIGPLGICVATGALPLSFIKSMNQEWYGHCFIFESGTESHFMTADTTILYLQELIGPVACFEFSKDD